MTPIVELPIESWVDPPPLPLVERAVCSLEAGAVLFFPRLAFPIDSSEEPLLSPAILAKGKNVTFDAETGRLGRTRLDARSRRRLSAMLLRFAHVATVFVENVLPSYADTLVRGRTSLRPVEIAGRAASWRKDDTRLHVDSFPASPLQGRRILRVFSNVDPEGGGRTWSVGEGFESVASRYLPSLSTRLWGHDWLLRAARLTRTRRSVYDHCMLQLHDRMKADGEYQERAQRRRFVFPAGSTWMVFTDQVTHAAHAGRHALEQTFYLPVSGMRDPSRSPLRVLERMVGRPLA